MRVRYHREALADLDQVREYIALNRPGVAVSIGQRIRGTIAGLSDFPERGRLGRVAGTRELVIPRLPFVVAYEVRADHVRVLAILHTAQNWPASFEDRA